ncbi:MAG: type IV toxin-antitoxin system AbiEi family antitoxin domain-containing protein [Solirubrobacteraceae bacterium]
MEIDDDVAGKYVPQRPQPLAREMGLTELAECQHGVVALSQLDPLGLSPSAVRKRISTGRLHRLHRGVCAIASAALLAQRAHWLAAVLACGPGAVLSHHAAIAARAIAGLT